MKLISTVVGAIIVFVITILTPWPAFISGIANELLALPEARGDAVWEALLRAFNIGVGYVVFPLLGAVIGLLVGFILERRYAR